MTCGTKEGEAHVYTPLKSIRRKCLDCCCGSSKEVDLCPVATCSLYPYRSGKSPRRKGTRPKGEIPPDCKNSTSLDGPKFRKPEMNSYPQGGIVFSSI
jgi:hypothetical protein